MAVKKAKATDDEAPDVSYVTVKAGTEGRVGLWEVDLAHESAGHEGGEIFVKDEPVKVAKTSGVGAALSDGRLVEASTKDAKE